MSHSRHMGSAGGEGYLQIHGGSQNIGIAWSARGLLTRIHLGKSRSARGDVRRDGELTAPARLVGLVEDLREYFRSGRPISRVSWEDVDLESWTEFQKRVYSATARIPHGESRTYGWVAQRIGVPAGSRAVGQALGRNPIPLLVPCHRVVSGRSGERALGGFMGESDPQAPALRLKMRLLELEDGFVNPRYL